MYKIIDWRLASLDYLNSNESYPSAPPLPHARTQGWDMCWPPTLRDPTHVGRLHLACCKLMNTTLLLRQSVGRAGAMWTLLRLWLPTYPEVGSDG